jgi:hypothetical protein
MVRRIAAAAALFMACGAGPAPSAWDAFARACSGLSGYTARVTAFERSGDRAQTLIIDYAFHKPENVTGRILDGPNRGAILVWDGGPTMRAHLGSGMLYGLAKTLPLHDPSATSVRGSSIDELAFPYVLAHGDDTPGSVVQQPGETIDGMPTDAIVLAPANPNADGGLTREVIELSAATHLPLRILGYEGAMLVRQVDYADLQLTR